MDATDKIDLQTVFSGPARYRAVRYVRLPLPRADCVQGLACKKSRTWLLQSFVDKIAVCHFSSDHLTTTREIGGRSD